MRVLVLKNYRSKKECFWNGMLWQVRIAILFVKVYAIICSFQIRVL